MLAREQTLKYELYVSPHILISAAYIYTHLHLFTPFVYPSTHCEAYYPTNSLIISNTLTRKHTFKSKGKVPVEYIVIIIINKHNVLTNGLTFFPLLRNLVCINNDLWIFFHSYILLFLLFNDDNFYLCRWSICIARCNNKHYQIMILYLK